MERFNVTRNGRKWKEEPTAYVTMEVTVGNGVDVVELEGMVRRVSMLYHLCSYTC